MSACVHGKIPDNSCGVPVTADEAETLIKSAYQTIKSDFITQVIKDVTREQNTVV
jgi:hypothetical protein